MGAAGSDWEAERSGSLKRKNISRGARKKMERREREDQVFEPEFKVGEETG